ncbi:MAG: 4'-phosphopantetheinyl transferase superfamily protein [Mucilaginibacter sp.]|uniref:4'-phosphopantetheinyl transferase family protein n=1 Tax=Mucilaginibacter sp. TaxID=1882438 RepID=UPI0031A6C985
MPVVVCKFIGPVIPESPSLLPPLTRQAVHVWSLWLPLVDNEKIISVLTPAEIARAVSYHQEADRSRFMKSRALVKLLIADYLDLDVADVVITTGTTQKPDIESCSKTLQYNISHSGDLTLAAIAYSAVGVDVEKVDPDYQYEDVFNICFNRREIDFIGDTGYVGFYKLWTMKEAIVKFTGKGIDDNMQYVPSLDGTYTVAESITEQHVQVYGFEPRKSYIGSVSCTNLINEVMFFDARSFLREYYSGHPVWDKSFTAI